MQFRPSSKAPDNDEKNAATGSLTVNCGTVRRGGDFYRPRATNPRKSICCKAAAAQKRSRPLSGCRIRTHLRSEDSWEREATHPPRHTEAGKAPTPRAGDLRRCRAARYGSRPETTAPRPPTTGTVGKERSNPKRNSRSPSEFLCRKGA